MAFDDKERVSVGKPSDQPITLKAIEELHSTINVLEGLINGALNEATAHFRINRMDGCVMEEKCDKQEESKVLTGIANAIRKVNNLCDSVRQITNQIQ